MYIQICVHAYTCVLKVVGCVLNINIILGSLINVLANKSIMTSGFTSWPVSVMIFDYRKSLLNHVGNLSLSKFTTHATEMPTICST